MPKVKKVFLSRNLEPTTVIEYDDVVVKYSDEETRYKLQYKWLFNRPIYIKKIDLVTGKKKIYNYFYILFQTFKSMTEYRNLNNENVIRNLIENQLI